MDDENLSDLKEKIESIEEFLEIWEKFRSIYKTILSHREIDDPNEMLFGDTISVIKRRVEQLQTELDLNNQENQDIKDAFEHILIIESLSNMSDSVIEGLDSNWQKVDDFLKKRLELLQNLLEKSPKRKSIFSIFRKKQK